MVDYMDLRIACQSGMGLTTDIYDKRFAPEFGSINLIRFPHVHSSISDTAKYGIITSQFIRFHRLCSLQSGFIAQISNLIAVFAAKGYVLRRLLSRLRLMLFKHPDMYAVPNPDWFFRTIRGRVAHLLATSKPCR
jgi:hypothetical protein